MVSSFGSRHVKDCTKTKRQEERTTSHVFAKFHAKLGNCKTSGCSTRSRSICGWAGLTQPDGRHADQRDPILAERGVKQQGRMCRKLICRVKGLVCKCSTHGSARIHRNLNCREEVPQPTLSSSPRGRATRALHHRRFCRFSLSLLSVAPNLLAATTLALRRDNKSDPV